MNRIARITDRIKLVPAGMSTSAEACIEDALKCVERHLNCAPGATLRHTWLDSAEMWMDRAGQHAFGYRLPKGW